MTPKEKAKELFIKFYVVELSDGTHLDKDAAIECALIAVDEMILVLPFTNTNTSLNEYAIYLQKYLLEVKQEIQNL
jgi:hypothetical protein